MNQIDILIKESEEGFKTLGVSSKYQNKALQFLHNWLTDEQFIDYVPQIENLIKNKNWDYLLDSFYQVIPFGTGGRRGEVGVGPNRINPWTIKASAQGHSQYLLKQYQGDAQNRGVVLAYDVRHFHGNQYLNEDIQNPVKDLTSKDLAVAAARVYVGNGIKVYIFDDIRTTPELSFAVRFLQAVGGDVFSASHNPPDHNGKKVYDEFGGQLIPPFDEELVQEVTQNVSKIHEVDYEEAKKQGLIEIIGEEIDKEYIKAVTEVSLSDKREVKIAYTPLHGCGSSSVCKSLRELGFEVFEDPKTSNPSGKFENVTFNIPNPEVEQSFTAPLKYAKEIQADILLNSDPDADRIGIMVKHNNDWVFLNGNEIAAILAEFVIQKRKPILKGKGAVIKTAVTSDVIREICKKHDIELIGDLLVGYKYIADVMNQLEKSGRMENFLYGCEESHGYNTGNYSREKDAAIAAIWLAELTAELKKDGKTLVDYLNQIYAAYGYFRNYLTEIRLPGAEGKSKIDQIQDSLRNSSPKKFGSFEVIKITDYQEEKPIVSETDRISKNILAFYFKPVPGTLSIKVTVRPSGTEPKTKIYFEIGSKPFELASIHKVKKDTEKVLLELEKAVMKYCYKLIGIDFPDRGFLLFWQLPLDIKLKYFDIEDQIAQLKDIQDSTERQYKLDNLLKFLGSNPTEKVDRAFQEKYQKPILNFLELED